MKKLIESISPVIAAAGKGTRAGLNYPKCLFEIKNKKILEYILLNFAFLPEKTHIIASINGKKHIQSFLASSNYKTSIVIQKQQLGMGNAVLQIESVSEALKDHILLIWGDIPFIQKKTIESLIKYYFHHNCDFGLVTQVTENPYTVVKRNPQGEIVNVIESHEDTDFKVDGFFGEREIGLFLFKKDLVLQYLRMELDGKLSKKSNEHGFLYIIQHLVKDGYKVGSVPATSKIESISFNKITDLMDLN